MDDDDRDAEFAPGNDRIWGVDNWIKCYECPRDSLGDPVYHHKNNHKK